jgi:hypothetical protein
MMIEKPMSKMTLAILNPSHSPNNPPLQLKAKYTDNGKPIT